MYTAVMHVGKIKVVFFFITFNLNHKGPEKRYKVTLFSAQMRIFNMGKCIVLGAYDERNVQMFLICRSGVVHVVYNIKFW